MAVTGLSLGNAKIERVQATPVARGGGVAYIDINSANLADLDTIVGNRGSEVTITDEQYSSYIFHGVVIDYEVLNTSLIQLQVIEQIRNTALQRTNHNPIDKSGRLKYVYDNNAEDNDAPYSASWGTNSRLVSVRPESLTSIILHPKSYSTTMTHVSGTVNALYHHDSNIEFTAADNGKVVEFVFDVYLKENTTIESIYVSLQAILTTWDGGYFNNPDIEIYNYSSLSWDDVALLNDDDTDGAELGTKDYVLESTAVSGTLYNYVDAQGTGTANSSDYIQYELKVRWYSGQVIDGGTTSTDFWADFVKIEINTDINQDVAVGQAIVDSSTTTSKLVFDNVTPSYGLTNFPAADGVGRDDVYYITKNVNQILDDIFGAADTDFTLSRDITDADQEAIPRDITNETINDILTEVSIMLNAEYWQSAADQITIKSIDNLSSTSIVLDKADYNQRPTYYEDLSNLRDEIIVIGAYGYTDPVAVTPEYNMEGGNRQEIVVDHDAVTRKGMNTKAANLATVHSKSIKEIRNVVLDFRDPNQNYSAIGLYKTIGIKIYDDQNNVKFDFTAGNLGEMTIVGINYLWTNQIENVTLTLRRLYS